MDDSRALDNSASRLPVEVCENVIDMLYSLVLQDQLEHTRTLRSCALVCKAWRVRSQRNLFYSVVLHGTEAMRRLAAVLDNGPHLCDYVREVVLTGRTFHTTANPLSLFPTILYGKLPKLQEVSISDEMCGQHHLPTTSDQGTFKALEHLPLHPRFPLLLSKFVTVTSLFIFHITFRHFNDLLGMLNSLPSLRGLNCQGVQFKTFGHLPLYMKQRTKVGHSGELPFAPNMYNLSLVCHLQRK